jgi:hypothetical protein
MNHQGLPKYAPEYSKNERIRHVAFGVIASSIIILICGNYVLPWLEQSVSSAPCREIFGINGWKVLMYCLFIGFPLSAGLLYGGILGYESYKIIRDGQWPPMGQKVLRPTKIKRGKTALLIAYLNLLPALMFITLAIWGSGTADYMAKLYKPGVIDCRNLR